MTNVVVWCNGSCRRLLVRSGRAFGSIMAIRREKAFPQRPRAA